MSTTIKDILSLHQQIIKDHEEKKSNDKNKKIWQDLINCTSDKTSFDVLQDIEHQTIEEDESSVYNFYLLSVIPILDEYDVFKKKMKNISFFNREKPHVAQNQQHSEKCKQLIDEYLQKVAYFFGDKYISSNSKTTNTTEDNNKIIKDNIVEETKRNQSISICKLCLSTNIIIDESEYVCKECGNSLEKSNEQLISYKDISRISISSKYAYDRRSHFRDCIKRFQGKQTVNIPNNVFISIYDELKNYSLIPSEYNIKENNPEIFQHINREHILIILKELNLSKYYEHLTYIYHKVTQKDIPNITNLEEILMSDFDKLLELYDNSYSSERKNFINNNYILYQLLKKNNCYFPKTNFTTLKTNDRKAFHDEICQKLFEALDWNFSPAF
jgi:hypothetical protein